MFYGILKYDKRKYIKRNFAVKYMESQMQMFFYEH